jgi:hypothetical protein
LGAARDGAESEQGVGDQDTGHENLARDEDLTDLESIGRLAPAVKMKLEILWVCRRMSREQPRQPTKPR